MKRGIFKQGLLLLLLFCSFYCWPQSTVTPPPILFVYPKIDSPVKAVFETIIKGFEETTKSLDVHYLPINNQDHTKSLVDRLKATAPSPVVVLGNHAYSLVNIPSLQNRIIVGAVRDTPEDSKHSLLSLSMEVNAIKNKLRQVIPHIKIVHFGDDSQKSLWFTPSQTLPSFRISPINNDQTSLVQYLWKTILEANPKTEAVWINSRIEPYNLYKLSEKAWERGVILISNNPLHLGQGATLIFYTDNLGMGERLGTMARNQLLHNNQKQIEALQAINMGINIRFAKHAGISIPADLKNTFQVIK